MNSFLINSKPLDYLKSKFIFLCVFTMLSLYISFASIASATQFTQQQTNEILYHIHTYYVDDVPLSQYHKSNLNDVFEQLDPYSKYLSASELESLFSAANGRYTGIGIEVEEVNDRIVILGTLPGSPT